MIAGSPRARDTQAGAMVRDSFLEDSVIQAETYRLSGSEPATGDSGIPGTGTRTCKGQELS